MAVETAKKTKTPEGNPSGTEQGAGTTYTQSQLEAMDNEPSFWDNQAKTQEQWINQANAATTPTALTGKPANVLPATEQNTETTDAYKDVMKDFSKNPNATEEAITGKKAETYAPIQESAMMQKQYGADWGNGFNKKTLRDSKLTLSEAIASYKKYKTEHPEAPDLDMMDFYATLKDKDLDKSMSENEADEKKAKDNEKWENIQNALFSFADMYNSAKGAPAPENAETPLQLTKRQEERRDKVKAMRDKDWQTYMALYQKQQANDLAKRKQASTEAKQQADQDYKRQMMDIKIKESAAKGDLNALKAQLDEVKLEGMRAKNQADKKLWDLKAKQIEAQIKYTNERSRGGGKSGSGKPTYDTTTTQTTTKGYDENDNQTTTVKKEVTHTPVGGGGKAKAKTTATQKKTHKSNPFG